MCPSQLRLIQTDIQKQAHQISDETFCSRVPGTACEISKCWVLFLADVQVIHAVRKIFNMGDQNKNGAWTALIEAITTTPE